MPVYQSHGRLTRILAVLAVLVWVSFGSGIWILSKVYQSQLEVNRPPGVNYLSAEAEILAESLDHEIDALRMRAQSLGESSPTVQSMGPILYWAELDVSQNRMNGPRRSAKNPNWPMNVTVADSFLRTSLSLFNLKDVQAQGVAMVRLKRDRDGRSEWLSLAFPSQVSSQILNWVLVDPSEFFTSFRSWEKHADGGKSRSYVLGSDGLILAHSQKSLAFSSLKSLSSFQDALKNMGREMGKGALETDFESIDHSPVRASYLPLSRIPLLVVVEEANDHTSMGWLYSIPLWESFAEVMGLMSVMTFLCALVLRRWGREKIRVPVRVFQNNPTHENNEVEQNNEDILSGNELLILESTTETPIKQV